MISKFLTIMTPTYNRAHTLPKLYESLCTQTDKNFNWIIVDDGSTDNTYELVKAWTEDSKINIKYYYQENQGMNVAINKGIKIAETELFVWIGSDDYLPDDMVKNISDLWESKKNISDNIGGIIGLDTKFNGDVIGSELPKDMIYINYHKLTQKYKMTGDKTYVYRLDILKENLFPIFEKEKEMVTAYMHCKIGEKYDLLIINKSLCNVYYSEDGISNNYWMTIKNNSKGHSYYHNYRMSKEKNIKYVYKHAANYVICSFFNKDNKFLIKSSRKIITILSIPAALYIYFYRYIVKKGKNPSMKNN